MPRLDDEQVFIELHAAELGALGLKQMPDNRAGRPGIVRKSEGKGLLGVILFTIFVWEICDNKSKFPVNRYTSFSPFPL